MPKSLIVVTRGNRGGAQRFVLDLAQELRHHGWDTELGVGEEGFVLDEAKKNGIHATLLKNLRRSGNIFKALGFIGELKHLIDARAIDILHLNSSNALVGAIAARLSRRKPPVVFTFHGLSVLDPGYRAPRLLKVIYTTYFKLFSRGIDLGVFVSERNAAAGTALGLARRSMTIYNGIAPHEGLPRHEARALLFAHRALPDDAFVFGSIGRFAYPKQYDFFIRAFPEILTKVPNGYAVFIGDGPDRKTYEALARSLGIADRVIFAGELDGQQYLTGFDVFFLTSVYEGLPYSLLEAMAAGIPAIAPGVGGIPELLPPEALYAPGDSASLIAHCVALAHSENERRTRREEEQKRYRAFSLSHMGERYAKAYASLRERREQ